MWDVNYVNLTDNDASKAINGLQKGTGCFGMLNYASDTYFIFDKHRVVEIRLKDYVCGALEATHINFDSGIIEYKAVSIPFSIGRFKLPYSVNNYRTDVRTDNEHYVIRKNDNGKHISVIHGRFFGNAPLVVDVSTSNNCADVSTYVKSNGRVVDYIYTTINSGYTGEISISDDVYLFNNAHCVYISRRSSRKPDECYCVFAGVVNGGTFSLNAFGNLTDKDIEYVGTVIYNGSHTALKNISIVKNIENNVWNIRDKDGILNISFVSCTERSVCSKTGVKRMYGFFNGSIHIENTAPIEISAFTGFMDVAE